MKAENKKVFNKSAAFQRHIINCQTMAIWQFISLSLLSRCCMHHLVVVEIIHFCSHAFFSPPFSCSHDDRLLLLVGHITTERIFFFHQRRAFFSPTPKCHLPAGLLFYFPLILFLFPSVFFVFFFLARMKNSLLMVRFNFFFFATAVCYFRRIRVRKSQNALVAIFFFIPLQKKTKGKWHFVNGMRHV